MNEMAKKVCNIILDVLIVLCGIIFLISLYSDIQVKVLKKGHADFFGFSTFEVQTGSMAPTINAGDVIIVKNSTNPEVKDIITYKSGKDYITHRVVESYKGTYVTKGDANKAKDEAIKKDQVVGKVIKVIPKLGVVRKTILNPIVLITLIITMSIISFMFGKDNKNIINNLIAKFKKKKIEKVEPIVEEIAVEKEEPSKDDIAVMEYFNSVEATEEELDKTMYYRRVSVDKEDLEPTVVVEDVQEEINYTEVADEVEEEINEDNSLVEVKLEYLNKKKKKFDNVIEKIMFIKEEEIKNLITTLTSNSKVKLNESTIKDTFIKNYMDAKYYNYCGNIDLSYNAKNMNSKLEELLKDTANSLIKNYSGSDKKYNEKVDYYLNMFSLILHLESIYSSSLKMDGKVESYQKKMIKYFKEDYTDNKETVKKIKELMLIQKTYEKVYEMALEKLETNTFILKYNELSTKKNMYGLTLEHNINFSKVYSDYIVDKTYDEGIVAEDKVLVTVNILLGRIAKDMLSMNFKNRYLLYIPESLYDKDNKLSKVLKFLDSEIAKKFVLILIKYDALVANKKVIKKLKKMGYRIALVFDDYKQIKAKDKDSIILVDYIFVDKKINKLLGISSLIPSELKKNLVLEDIVSKVDMAGGE